ncbi:xylem cysteine peptidase 1 [Striga asiatica]|uniref:Xylem cysteine peptidase 1 n=1 Tax=Striga asiatica TaxID=4170 RepID=A0A5A7Q8N0_STRAF|nr:xylem cysteine peptidase 1 [Striga asiatica]
MLGLNSGSDLVHAKPNLTSLSISLPSYSPPNLQSTNSSFLRTLPTNITSRSRKSTAARPVTTSSTTTPKLYTSAAAVASPDSMYSGDIYPKIPRTDFFFSSAVMISCGPPCSFLVRNSASANEPSLGFASRSSITAEEVADCGCEGLDDVVPLAPAQTGERVPEDAARRVVVHHEHLPALGAPPAELREVPVAEPPHVPELVREPHAQGGTRLHPEPLHDDVAAAFEEAAVGRSEVDLRQPVGV